MQKVIDIYPKVGNCSFKCFFIVTALVVFHIVFFKVSTTSTSLLLPYEYLLQENVGTQLVKFYTLCEVFNFTVSETLLGLLLHH